MPQNLSHVCNKSYLSRLFASFFGQIVKLHRLLSGLEVSVRSHRAGDHGAHTVDAPGLHGGHGIGGGIGVGGSHGVRGDLESEALCDLIEENLPSITLTSLAGALGATATV